MQEKVNFIHTIAPERQREYRRWFLISCALLLLVLLVIGIMQARQILAYRQARQALESLQPADETVLQKQQMLKTQLHALQQDEQAIQRYEKELHAMQQTLARANRLQQYGQIESIHMTLQKTDVLLQVMSFQQVQALLQMAQKEDGLKLLHIEPKQQGYRVTVQLV